MDTIKREMSVPISFGMDARDICFRKLKRRSSVICSIRFASIVDPPKVDASTDFAKLKVGEIKRLLSEKGVPCEGCVEKSDFVRKIKEVMGKGEL